MATFTLPASILNVLHKIPYSPLHTQEALFAAAACVVTGAVAGKIGKDLVRREAIRIQSQAVQDMMRGPDIMDQRGEIMCKQGNIEELAAHIGIQQAPKLPNFKPFFKEVGWVFSRAFFD